MASKTRNLITTKFQVISRRVIFSLLLLNIITSIINVNAQNSSIISVSTKIIPLINNLIFILIVIKIYGFANKVEVMDTDKGIKEIFKDYSMGALNYLLNFNNELITIANQTAMMIIIALGAPAILLFNYFRKELLKTWELKYNSKNLVLKKLIIVIPLGASLITFIAGLLFIFVVNIQLTGIVFF